MLWLTLVVAVGLGWLAREQHFGSKMAIIEKLVKYDDMYRGRIGALLYYIETVDGCTVTSGANGTKLYIDSPNGTVTYDVFDFDDSSLSCSK